MVYQMFSKDCVESLRVSLWCLYFFLSYGCLAKSHILYPIIANYSSIHRAYKTSLHSLFPIFSFFRYVYFTSAHRVHYKKMFTVYIKLSYHEKLSVCNIRAAVINLFSTFVLNFTHHISTWFLQSCGIIFVHKQILNILKKKVGLFKKK